MFATLITLALGAALQVAPPASASFAAPPPIDVAARIEAARKEYEASITTPRQKVELLQQRTATARARVEELDRHVAGCQESLSLLAQEELERFLVLRTTFSGDELERQLELATAESGVQRQRLETSLMLAQADAGDARARLAALEGELRLAQVSDRQASPDAGPPPRPLTERLSGQALARLLAEAEAISLLAWREVPVAWVNRDVVILGAP